MLNTNLVDGTGDKARDMRLCAVDLRKRAGERRCGLDSYEMTLANVVTIGEAESRFALIVWNASCNPEYIFVESASVVRSKCELTR